MSPAEKMSYYCFVAASISVALAALLRLVGALVARRQAVVAVGLAKAAATEAATGADVGRMQATRSPNYGLVGSYANRSGLGAYGGTFAALGLALLTLCIALRGIAAGRGPFANQYEFSVAFAWGIVGAGLYFERRYRLPALGTIVLPVALGLLVYASALPSAIQPLVPALQNSLLLTTHVAVAIVAYGTFSVAFGAALLYLYQSRAKSDELPSPESLDEIGYRAVIVGFPLLTLVIVLGAVWANVAWGAYWSWDPKETASLVTWLIYGGYIHARGVRGWRGNRAAVLLIFGFAATVFAYFGNTFFGGLHSYAGLG